MKAILTILMILIPILSWSQNENLSPPGQVKEWHFPIQHGELTITLSSFQNQGHVRDVLTLSPATRDAETTISEETGLLREVFKEMPSLGYDPQDIDEIFSGLQEKDLLRKLQLAFLNSSQWRLCKRRKGCVASVGFVVQFLRSSNAYEEFGDALRAYGAHGAHVAGVEDLFSKPMPDPRPVSTSGAHKLLILPCAAMVTITITQE